MQPHHRPNDCGWSPPTVSALRSRVLDGFAKLSRLCAVCTTRTCRAVHARTDVGKKLWKVMAKIFKNDRTQRLVGWVMNEATKKMEIAGRREERYEKAAKLAEKLTRAALFSAHHGIMSARAPLSIAARMVGTCSDPSPVKFEVAAEARCKEFYVIVCTWKAT